MNISSLKYFITLSEQLHFGRAADMLYISQSTLSYHIQELENELGIKLFVRNNRKVLLSNAGAAILPLARQLVQISDNLTETASAASSKAPDINKLHLSLDSCFERFDLLGLPDAISSLRQEYPEIDVSICQDDYEQLVTHVESSQYDLGIGVLRYKEKTSPLLNVLPLYEDSFSIIHNIPDYKNLTVQEILNTAVIFLISDDQRWSGYITNWLFAHGSTKPPVLLKNFSDILTHVYFGEGITIMPTLQGETEAITRPGINVLNIDSPDFIMRICAFWAKENYNYAITQLLSKINISPSVTKQLW